MVQEHINRLEQEIMDNLEIIELLEPKRAKRIKRSSEYQEYIKSKEWQETRQRILKRDSFRCVLCNNTKNLHVHHITYESLGEEKDADLVTLCECCHDKLHNSDIPMFPYRCLLRAKEISELYMKSDDEIHRTIGEMAFEICKEAREKFEAGIKRLEEEWERKNKT